MAHEVPQLDYEEQINRENVTFMEGLSPVNKVLQFGIVDGTEYEKGGTRIKCTLSSQECKTCVETWVIYQRDKGNSLLVIGHTYQEAFYWLTTLQ